MFLKTDAYNELLKRLGKGDPVITRWLSVLLPQVLPSTSFTKHHMGVSYLRGDCINSCIHDFRKARNWIKAAIANGEDWASDLMDGVPLKIHNTKSWGRLDKHISEDRRKCKARIEDLFNDCALKGLSRAELVRDGHIEIIEEGLKGDHSFVRLLTPFALDRQSFLMDNCTGYGYYDASVKNPAYGYYSLWDSSDQPYVMVEVADNHIIQCEGRMNVPATNKYLSLVEDFANRQGWDVRADVFKCGLSNRNGRVIACGFD